MNQISRNIKNIRKNLSLTQKDFALTIGVSEATISKIESGTRNPSLNVLKNIEEVYKIKITDITDNPEALKNDKQVELKVMFRSDRSNTTDEGKGSYLNFRGSWFKEIGIGSDRLVSIIYNKKEKRLEIKITDENIYKATFREKNKQYTLFFPNKWIRNLGITKENNVVLATLDKKNNMILIKSKVPKF